ncbi:recombinase family protein [Haloechinothrix salitolerans]|uniref:Recombinase family protein n=1 Tax=Haloechinothrix salitolerans TaxID=926830 RepID=A0ABW2C775_9PSEU
MTAAAAHTPLPAVSPAPFPVVLYARASQARDERSTSVEDQLEYLRNWARREGWTVVAEYRDDDVSASKFARHKARTGWDAVTAHLRNGTVRALLTWTFARNTRDRRVYAELADICEETGVLLGYSGRLRDFNDVDDGFGLDLDAAMAVRDSRLISKNVRQSTRSRAAKGRPHGDVPYGYKRIIDPDTGKSRGWAVHPQQGPIVKEIVRRLLAGEGCYPIATDLNRRGVPTAWAGRCAKECPCRETMPSRRPNRDYDGEHVTLNPPWRSGNLPKMVTRPVYAKYRVHDGQVVEGVRGTWPRLVSDKDHHRLRRMFADPERDKFRNPKHSKHLGTGLFRCGRCESGRMRVTIQKGGNDYGCRDCFRVSRRQAPVDAYVERTVIRRLSRPDALTLLSSKQDTAHADAARAEVERLRAEMAEAQKALREGRLNPLDMATYREGWEPRFAAAEAAAQPPELPDAVVNMAGPDAEKRWKAASLATRRQVLDALYTVTILPVGRNAVKFSTSGVQITPK